MASFCGNVSFADGTPFSMRLSGFQPDPSGIGGSVTIQLNGQVIAIWDCRDLSGALVPNSIYHVVLFETTSDGRSVRLERDVFITNNHGQGADLAARPNQGKPGDILQFLASFAGMPADDTSKIKIFTTSGELVRNLTVSGGTSSWDLRNEQGVFVASGIYFAALDGKDPASGLRSFKVIKLLVTH